MMFLIVRVIVACILLCVSVQAASWKHKSRKDTHVPSEVARRSSPRSYYIVHGCERTELAISCQDDLRLPESVSPDPVLRHRRISITHATYGRQSADVCRRDTIYDLNWSMPCVAPRKHTTSIVSRRCNGKTECQVPVVNAIFGDPCPDTYKYLEVYYACD